MCLDQPSLFCAFDWSFESNMCPARTVSALTVMLGSSCELLAHGRWSGMKLKFTRSDTRGRFGADAMFLSSL